MSLTNLTGISLAMSVWLAHDSYNNGAAQIPDKDVISVTTLLKPTRQFVLSQRVPQSDNIVDVADMISPRLGHALHDSIEDVWKNHYATSMERLGYPQSVIDRVKINPESVEGNDIPVYLELRTFKEFDGLVISGQLDQLIDGQINDTKSTSVYSYIHDNKEEDYRIQMSIYRWLNQDKVTESTGIIQFIFTDWQKSMSHSNPNYPNSRLQEKHIELMSISETEAWMRNKIAEIRSNVNLDEHAIVRCTDKELWRSDPVYKYFSDPSKVATGGRSTKNFTVYQEAMNHQAKAGKGTVVTVPGKVKACSYCPAFSICSQKDEYEHD